MITKNFKMVLLAVMLSAIVIPLGLMGNADAVNTQGKTVIEPEFVARSSPDTLALIALDEAYGEAETDEERQAIKAQAEKLLVKRTSTSFDQERTVMYLEAKDVLVDAIGEMSKIDGHNAIPYTRAGYSSETGMLIIAIHQDFATLENMEKYEKTIRSVIGDEIDLKLSNGGEYWQLATCNNGALADCDPLESGVEMQVTGMGNCTIGIRATYGGDDGYVTAGHCADGHEDDNVGQDSISSVIGTVSKETYNAGSSYETCDCAFIEIDSGSRTMDADVYWDSYYPTSEADASDEDYVKIYGKSGKTYGYVDGTCEDIVDNSSTTLKCVVIVDNAANGGDSGGAVVQTFDSTPEFHGIFVAYNNGLDLSAYVKHSKFTSHFSGLSWDF